MKRIVAAVLCALLFLSALPLAASANGGPFGVGQLVGGNIGYVDIPDIFVDREDLSVQLSVETSIVTAVYTLRNTGAARTVSYLFPVTEYIESDADSVPRLYWIDFYDGGTALPFDPADVPAQQQPATNADGMYEVGWQDIAAYQISC